MTRSKVRAGSKVGREIQRKLAKLGYSLDHLGGKTKHVLVGPDGEVVRRPNGMPFLIPNSPSDRRAYEIIRQRLREVGIDLDEA